MKMNFIPALCALVLALAVVATGCTPQNNEQSSSQLESQGSSSTAPDPTKSAELLKNLDYIFEEMPGYNELLSSKLLQKAIDEKAVIVLNDMILSTAYANEHGYDTGAIDFFRAVSSGEDNHIVHYAFYTSASQTKNAPQTPYLSAVRTELTLADGKLTVERNYASNWDELGEDGGADTYSDYRTAAYGVLSYGEAGSEAGAVYLIDEVREDELINRSAYLKYITPMAYDLATTGFSDRDGRRNYLFLCFEDLYNYETGHDLWTEFPDGNIPVATIVKYLQMYFDITEDEVVSKVIAGSGVAKYDSENGTVFYEGGRGGGPKYLRVRSVEEREGIKYITYENFDYATGVPYSRYLLTVRDEPDGSFKYLEDRRLGSVDTHLELKPTIEELINNATPTYLLYRGSMKLDLTAEPKSFKENGGDYYPAVDFTSIAQLKQYTETVFSQNFAENQLYDAFEGEVPLMVERDGRLYVFNGGMGWALSPIYQTIIVESATDSEIVFTMDSALFDSDVQCDRFYLVKQNDRWVIESFYGINEPYDE